MSNAKNFDILTISLSVH